MTVFVLHRNQKSSVQMKNHKKLERFYFVSENVKNEVLQFLQVAHFLPELKFLMLKNEKVKGILVML